MRGQERKPHDARTMAQSFGADPARYDRLRPTYPDELVAAVVAEAPGSDLLDVGCGTGIAARQFQAEGCMVQGVEPDPRMAAFASERGLQVDVARFEEWDSAGRTFDALISATTWHWIDPPAGAQLAASILRPAGLFAAFWNVHHLPPELGAAFNEIYARIAPGSLFAKHGGDAHHRVLNRSSRGLTDTGAFTKPRVRRYTWERTYTREQWLELTLTFGGTPQLAEGRRDELFADLGAAIDDHGGTVDATYETLLLTAVRT